MRAVPGRALLPGLHRRVWEIPVDVLGVTVHLSADAEGVAARRRFMNALMRREVASDVGERITVILAVRNHLAELRHRLSRKKSRSLNAQIEWRVIGNPPLLIFAPWEEQPVGVRLHVPHPRVVDSIHIRQDVGRVEVILAWRVTAREKGDDDRDEEHGARKHRRTPRVWFPKWVDGTLTCLRMSKLGKTRFNVAHFWLFVKTCI